MFASLPPPAGPASVDDISALPNNQNSIIATWLCPLPLNTHDPALLRYTLTYQQGFSLASSDPTGQASLILLLPTLLGGAESEDCLVETIVPDLTLSTTYALGVVPMAPGNVMGSEANDFAVATTFGGCKLIVAFPNPPTYHAHLFVNHAHSAPHGGRTDSGTFLRQQDCVCELGRPGDLSTSGCGHPLSDPI